MKRRALAWCLLFFGLIALLLLAGCGTPDYKDQDSDVDRRYKECLAAKGNWKYHGNSGSFDCTQPEVEIEGVLPSPY